MYGIQYIQKYVRSFGMICDYFEEFATVSPDDDSVFRIAKQMSSTNQVVIGENWVCNDAGELALTDESKMKARVRHYPRLLIVEIDELPAV